jgi:hypothetical protein
MKRELDARTLRCVAGRLKRDLKQVERTDDGSDSDAGYRMALHAYAVFYDREASRIEKRAGRRAR